MPESEFSGGVEECPVLCPAASPASPVGVGGASWFPEGRLPAHPPKYLGLWGKWSLGAGVSKVLAKPLGLKGLAG